MKNYSVNFHFNFREYVERSKVEIPLDFLKIKIDRIIIQFLKNYI